MNTTHKGLSLACILSEEALAELRCLLEGAELKADGGMDLQSKLVRVVVSVWESEAGAGRFDAHLTAFDAANRRVRLDGLALSGRGQDAVSVILRVGRVTERGDLALDELKAGIVYRLHSPAGISKPGKRSQQAWAAKGAEAVPSLQRTRTIESMDGALRGMLRFLSDGTVEVIFETTEARWADAMVRFALVDETGRVEFEREVRLETIRDGLWEGRGPEGIRVSAATDLVFEVQART